jgi:hypothetical protein
MHAHVVMQYPQYLPLNTAQLPFGDPMGGVTATAAAPGVFTIPGYRNPAVNDEISFTFTAGGSMPAPLVAGTTYYVQSVTSPDVVTLSATKGGAAITTTTTGANLVAHFLSQEAYGVRVGFKSNSPVLALNLTSSSVTLQGASDVNATAGNPGGPGTFSTIATIAAKSAALIQLSADWIQLSAAGTLVLLQN